MCAVVCALCHCSGVCVPVPCAAILPLLSVCCCLLSVPIYEDPLGSSVTSFRVFMLLILCIAILQSAREMGAAEEGVAAKLAALLNDDQRVGKPPKWAGLSASF